MIARLRGEVASIQDDCLVMDVAGVGYEVSCTGATLLSLRPGETTTLHIHTAVSADAIRLYGFGDSDELRVFRLLISVERIGPKAALAILGRGELSTLVRAIAEANVALLATAPGIGRKTAERLVLELKDKLGWLTEASLVGCASPAAGNPVGEAAVTALMGLGFREADARQAVAAAADTADLNATVTAALRRLDSTNRPS